MIFFVVAKKDQGSAILRGIQISDYLNQLGVNSKVVTIPEIPLNEINSLFVWVKNIDIKIIKQLANNIHVYDVVDNYIYQKELVQSVIKSGKVNHVIVNNEFMKSEIHNENKISLNDISVIHHHWDPRITAAKKENQSNLTFGFLGSVASLAHTDNFLHYRTLAKQYNVRFYDTEIGKDVSNLVNADKKIVVNRNPNAMQELKIHFNCHISIRKENSSESKYKTSAKVVTASALNHNILTTYEKATKDILPKNYPFILKNTNFKTIQAMFDLIISDYADEKILWKTGLQIMSSLKEQTSLTKIAKDYLFIINKLT
tara:strand:- start:310 stop:1254 length:945 start_codon:yes stop_codon:yes gene_type:complete